MFTRVSYEDIRAYMQPYDRFFLRSETRELAARYIMGLIVEGERKSVQPISQRVHASERGLQRLLNRAAWDHAGLAADYRLRLHAICGDHCEVLCVDDVWFRKKGKHSVCVARHYVSDLNEKVGAQLGVGLAMAGIDNSWPLMLDLYVPKFWDRKRDKATSALRKKTGMPDDARHREKWQTTLDQIQTVIEEGIACRVLVAPKEYGNVLEFRRSLARQAISYVLEVDPALEVFPAQPVFNEIKKKKRGRGRPKRREGNLEPQTPPVKILSLAGQTENHDDAIRNNKAAALRVWPAQGYQEGIRNDPVWLIMERSPGSGNNHLDRFYFSNMPLSASAVEILSLCHRRERVNDLYMFLEKRLGLDHHEGRSWTGWHRHVLLVFLAYGYLATFLADPLQLDSH